MADIFLTEANQFLQRAIARLSKGEVEDTISCITNARNKLAQDFSVTTFGSNEYKVLRQITCLMQCATLHYFTLAKREQNKGNDALTLVYLSHALGISITLDSLVLPLIERPSETKYTDSELLLILEMNNGVREALCKSTTHVMSRLEGNEKKAMLQDMDQSVAKIVDSVDSASAVLRETAIELGRRFRAGDFKQARKLFEFVRDEIQYVYDPRGLDAIQSPEVTLKLRAGDCEDQAILLSSLLAAIGFEAALIFADTDNNGVPDHVYSAVHLPDAPEYTKPFKREKGKDGKNLYDWVPLDPASQDSDFGVIPIQDLQIVKLVQVPPRKT